MRACPQCLRTCPDDTDFCPRDGAPRHKRQRTLAQRRRGAEQEGQEKEESHTPARLIVTFFLVQFHLFSASLREISSW
jgi:hypothetical protein